MNLSKINDLLTSVKAKLESIDLQAMAEQKMASEQHPKRLAGAKKRLDVLYKKLTANRGPDLQVQATGSKRRG